MVKVYELVVKVSINDNCDIWKLQISTSTIIRTQTSMTSRYQNSKHDMSIDCICYKEHTKINQFKRSSYAKVMNLQSWVLLMFLIFFTE